jgi:hypothetical protein
MMINQNVLDCKRVGEEFEKSHKSGISGGDFFINQYLWGKKRPSEIVGKSCSELEFGPESSFFPLK